MKILISRSSRFEHILMPDSRNAILDTPISRLYWLVALLFAALYVTVPWPDIFFRIYGHAMLDRTVYQIQIESNNLRGDYSGFSDPLSLLTSEYLWSRTLRWLYSDLSLPVSLIFLLISFTSILIFSLTLLRTLRWYWLVALVNPLVVDLAFSQLRLALAISIMLIVYLSVRAGLLRRLVLATASTMIHTATVLFVAMYLVSVSASKQVAHLREYRALAMAIGTGCLISLAIGPAREIILTQIGDRRAIYVDIASSPLYLSFWIILLSILVIRWRAIGGSIEASIAVIVLSLVTSNIFTGSYSTRFIAAAFPFIVISMARLDGIVKPLTVLMFLAYVIFQWFYWLRLVVV
ncbi:hypothetical protein [Brevundimonas vesicularis]|uniref:hypothetical protein n=1 Tax=Brevundimonas vesicularis TaxID=41276 RepID=UPI00384C7B70